MVIKILNFKLNELLNFNIWNLENVPIEVALIEDPFKIGPSERWYIILLQVLFPFFIAGFGMVAAGVVLDKVQVIIFPI